MEVKNKAKELYTQGRVLAQSRKIAEALQKLNEAAVLGNPSAQNAVAWTLATSPDERLRDGGKALELALKAVASSNRRDFGFLDTLAAAYAENGDFTNAVRVQEEVLRFPNLEPRFVEQFKLHLEAYKSNKPFREAELFF